MITGHAAPVSEDVIRRALAEFEIKEVSSEQVQQIQRYIGLLLAWNDKVNLTAIRDPLEVLYRHFCESMFGAIMVPVEKGRLADVGSGGGFPGLPMKILRPELQVLLIESNVKKATFLAEVIRELRLSEARVLVSRYEELSEEVAPLDYVCVRAVGEFAPLLAWAATPQIAAKEIILWTGSRDLEEIKKRGAAWEWREAVAVPHSLRRYLLAGARKIDAAAS